MSLAALTSSARRFRWGLHNLKVAMRRLSRTIEAFPGRRDAVTIQLVLTDIQIELFNFSRMARADFLPPSREDWRRWKDHTYSIRSVTP